MRITHKWQTRSDLRVLLAFYASGDEADKAFRSIQKLGVKNAVRVPPETAVELGVTQAFADLRCADETLIICGASAQITKTALTALRQSGSPSVFVVRPTISSQELPRPNAKGSILKALAAHEIAIESVRSDLAEATRLDHAPTAAAEWLLDNAYLVRAHIADVRRNLPRNYAKYLPRSDNQVRIYDLARELAAQLDIAIDQARVSAFLKQWQAQAPLMIAELWFFPLMLRAALIEGLVELSAAVNHAQQCRELAYLWANRFAVHTRHDPGGYETLQALLDKQPYARDAHFATTLAEQLQGEEAVLVPLQHWIEQAFGTTVGELVLQEHAKEAALRLSAANAFGSLRAIEAMDYGQVFESVSVVEGILRQDPSGVYPQSDFATRDQCRRAVERIARHAGSPEPEVASIAASMAASEGARQPRCVPYFLMAEGIPDLEQACHARSHSRLSVSRSLRRHATGFYLGSVAILTACLLDLSLYLAWDLGVHKAGALVALGILALFPLGELAIQILHGLIVSLFIPEPLAKMDFQTGIPENSATLVVVPMMLSSAAACKKELEKLEVRFLANRERNLAFSLFGDYTDHTESSHPDDAALLEVLRAGIIDLNARYPDSHFALFHRERDWSETQRCWMGRERKRGKLEDLNAYLLGLYPAELCVAGVLPCKIRYVITLDSDTQLPPGTALRMVETIAHPLNRPQWDREKQIRIRGYSVIQPRVTAYLPSSTATRFTQIFSDPTGVDPYHRSISDAHQDLFREAAFYGKGIYDVEAFHTLLSDRFPPETILSHDLIEGAHTGVALATDIELFENTPSDYASYAKREHRWIRGDWQILDWIFPTVPDATRGRAPNPLSAISRWRIFDNLRRSLTPLCCVVLILFAWLTSSAPNLWILVVSVGLFVPAIAPIADRFAHRIGGTVHRWRGAEREFVRALVNTAFLPYQAWVSTDAIVRALYRRYVSGRNLLEWQCSDVAEVHLAKVPAFTVRRMVFISALSLILAIVGGSSGKPLATAMVLLLWSLEPPLFHWLRLPGIVPQWKRLDSDDTCYLRRAARRTWRYFDDLVNAESNWLPPDNTQLALRVEVAQRTSPTNIGLWFTSALAAVDLGCLTTEEFLSRCEHTMDTLERMERYEGHLLNWYNTRTLDPLPPRYVSTVDSGNLIANLWVFAQGCREIIHEPVISRRSLHGLSDTLAVARQSCTKDPSIDDSLAALHRILMGRIGRGPLQQRLALAAAPIERLKESVEWKSPGLEECYWLKCLIRELERWEEVHRTYLEWMEVLAQPPDSTIKELGPAVMKVRRKTLRLSPSLFDLMNHRLPLALQPLGEGRHREWLERLQATHETAKANAAHTVFRLEHLAERCLRFADSINMRFLYDPARRLFAIGYALGQPLQFTHHYDLLGSESRLASFVAIAKGDAPVDHWFRLARPRVTLPGGSQVLLSWSGTMFEYLMPLLFMRSYENSLLQEACSEAVRKQAEYGHRNHVPWGISESAYSALDSNRVYQYRAFGVPDLAFHQPVEDEMVVAPYATILALGVDANAAVANLRRLETLGLRGPMGFYESIDFGREVSETGSQGVVVYAHMAHHQGMSLLALNNVLHSEQTRRRFHADVRVKAIEALLFEQVPITRAPSEEIEKQPRTFRLERKDGFAGRTWVEATSSPRIFLTGNRRYSLVLTNSGGGYSRWNEFDITRWRSDSAGEECGGQIYIRDRQSRHSWSAAGASRSPANAETFVHFSADHAEFHYLIDDIESITRIAVAPDDDVELRQVTLANRSFKRREVELTSYFELALAPHAWDASHPAFAKMFVQTERWDRNVLVARRRPRSPEEPTVWATHMVLGAEGQIRCETDRAKYKARARQGHRLAGGLGTVLDPIFSLQCSAVLEPRKRTTITFLTMAASSRDALLAMVDRYREPALAGRIFELAWTRTQLQYRYLKIGPSEAHRFQELARYLVFPNSWLRALSGVPSAVFGGLPVLWKHGISGDLPILTVAIAEGTQLRLLREVLVAHTYWRLLGFRADLLVLSEEGASYDRPLYQDATRLIAAHSELTGIDQPGGVFLKERHLQPDGDVNALLAASSVVLRGSRGSLQNQLIDPSESPPAPELVASYQHEEPSAPLPFLELDYFNGLGGFSKDGREYAVYLRSGSDTPVPWVNVLANAEFGSVISESGLGFTWCGNSQTNRLTPWHNDPVEDPQSEIIYVRDDESSSAWSPTPLPIREEDAYRARHGHGYTVYEHNSHSIEQELTVFVPAGDGQAIPVKVYRLRLRNASSRIRRLTVMYFAEWVLGNNREIQQLHVRTGYDEASGALTAVQHWVGSHAGRIAFAAMYPRASSYTGDRLQFIGRHRRPQNAAALKQVRLGNRAGVGADPCAALQTTLTIEPGQQVEVIVLLGQVKVIGEVRGLVARFDSGEKVASALEETQEWWDARLSTIQVSTPVKSVDLLLNRWLPYQALACRFWARSALYQSSGAFGFRDQLQDAMALVYFAPELTRQHILTAASRQFPEGDVQHWWHPDTGAGVRTRCSDDLVWLPYTVAHYVTVTGDAGILDQSVPFVTGAALGPEEHERMFTPTQSGEQVSLWEHCRRALDRAWQLGPHGLPLFGSGDWNDGMNRVGYEGRGESVWLAFFLGETLRLFADLTAGQKNHPELVERWREKRRALETAISRHAWDGEWYLRGFFDNGTPLGSKTATEARIDVLPQAWPVIADMGDPTRARQAMESADRQLVDESNRLVRLLTPPFDHSEPNPGYIMGYPPGIRENGGQYTHGSLWAALAWARLGEGSKAVRLLMLMNPIEKARDPDSVEKYRVEPYVSPADVYSAPERIGQGGWTWYTGSAAWMYRVWLEGVLGFRLTGTVLRIRPVMPDDWDGFRISYRYRSSIYEIEVRRGREMMVELDGHEITDSSIDLVDDMSTHRLLVQIAQLPGRPNEVVQNDAGHREAITAIDRA